MLRKVLFSPLASSTFSYGRHKCFQLRLFSSNKKVYELNATQVEERLAVLREVYSPLMNYKKGSQEWTKLIKSGKIWENYFRPFEWRAQDYDFQAKYGDFLKEIDALKASAKIPAVDLLRSMTVSFSQQSCAIEGNTLGLYDTQKVWNSLRRNFDLNNFLKDSETPLPTPSSLSDEPENEVIEIRNHLLATHFLYSTLYDLTHEIDLCHIKRLHRILLKDTPMEKVELEDDKFHDNEDELIQHVGDFRKIEVESRGSIYTVYPLPMEVSALMERFIQFRDESIKNSGFHPIIVACRILSTFLHIHPFIDGNGRVGRLIMALYLIRNGYPPIVFQQVPREEYGVLLFLAQAEKDSTGLYTLIVQNIFNILMRYQVIEK